jgi:peroxin-7
MINMKNNFQRYYSEFEGYSCKFSPFSPNLIACAFSQYYGFVGNGRLSIFSQNQTTGILEEIQRFNTNNGIFEIEWSEVNENQILTGSGDGFLRLWDLNQKLPLIALREHVGEIYGVGWNHASPNLVASGGMDKTVRVYDLEKGVPLQNLAEHREVVHCVSWHPTLGNILASASSDHTVKLWDIKSGRSIKTLAGQSEALSCDFNKYENTIAVANSDRSVTLFDLRASGDIPLTELNGHQLTCRKVAFSPFFPNILASVGYDMNVILWDLKKSSIVNVFKHHREFVIGVDFSLHDKKKIASTGWDKSLYIFNWDEQFSC